MIYSNDATYDIICYYNINDTGWQEYTGGGFIFLWEGQFVRFKCDTTTFSSSNRYYRIATHGRFKVSGNIMSLINYAPLSEYCFYNLFKYNYDLIDASQLVLPATTLADYCYYYMFYYCYNLIAGPKILATTDAIGCFMNMFVSCYGLTDSPQIFVSIPSSPNSFDQMFNECNALSSVTTHFTQWGNYATQYWLSNVAYNGVFNCPAALGDNDTIHRGDWFCPYYWTVINI